MKFDTPLVAGGDECGRREGRGSGLGRGCGFLLY